jgi:hypothetical protein
MQAVASGSGGDDAAATIAGTGARAALIVIGIPPDITP